MPLPTPTLPSADTARIATARQRLRVKPRLANRLQRQGQGGIGRVNAQRARAQLKPERADAGYRLQGAADVGLFSAAVHGGDAKQLPGGAQRGCGLHGRTGWRMHMVCAAAIGSAVGLG